MLSTSSRAVLIHFRGLICRFPSPFGTVQGKNDLSRRKESQANGTEPKALGASVVPSATGSSSKTIILSLKPLCHSKKSGQTPTLKIFIVMKAPAVEVNASNRSSKAILQGIKRP